jgi:hypothetical protein
MLLKDTCYEIRTLLTPQRIERLDNQSKRRILAKILDPITREDFTILPVDVNSMGQAMGDLTCGRSVVTVR